MTGIGIVGIGGWGKNHVRVLSSLKAEGIIDYVGIADISESLIKKYSKNYSIDFKARNIEELLRFDEIDGVIIATPTPLHYDHAIKALEADRHVLVEKPLTSTSEEAKSLNKVAKEKKKILMVGFLLRFSPAVIHAKKLIEKGDMGSIISISAKRTSLWPNRKLDVEIIRDLAVHDIDLVRFMTGALPKKVYAVGGSKLHGLLDHTAILFEYSKGNSKTFPVLIEASWVTPFKIRRLEITGDKGSAFIELLEHKITIAEHEKIIQPILKQLEPLYAEDKNFALSIQGKERPFITGEDGIIALKACEAAIESIEKHTIVEINY